ncbi:tyrosine-type recombinase/integrase [Desulfosporosinus sp. I2]|uniref:tyrosine-type recombinase/integrase n=1 Tax=Desulfosporosinus sp. I2 TaxID=1617025 RepID=UPI001A9A53E2|nr:tyrosine-type recombinase/integrase [Desulfosporosinus sp. I2]
MKARFFTPDIGLRTEYLIFHASYERYPYFPNRFLRVAGRRSENTGKQYAYKLCKFLNYMIDIKQKEYAEVTNKDIHDFFYWLAFGLSSTDFYYIQGGQISYSTLNAYHGLLVKFYQFLSSKMDIKVQLEIVSKTNKHSFYYGQIWSKPVSSLIDENRLRAKDCRNHHKWYSPEEQTTILSHLPTLRDQAIFSLSCDSLRIGEILSLRIQDYVPSDGVVSLYASKGKPTGKVNISVPLSNRSIQLLDNYLFNERDSVLAEALKQGHYPTALFLNIKAGAKIGAPLTYRNFLTILKRAAKRAGFDPSEIRTHSGRSTAVMDMLHAQSENPEANISQNDVLQQFRWKSPTSIQPYINTRDIRTKKKLMKLIEEQRRSITNE